MKYVLGILIMIWSVFSSAKDYPEVVVGEEEGFVDLTFTISNSKKFESGAHEVVVKGNLKGDQVGFAIELLPSWNPKAIEGTDDAFYWGEAFFKNTGPESDSFIRALALLYGATLADASVPDKVYAQVVGLGCNPGQLEVSACKMKFFFSPDGDEGLYSEVFINIDLAAKKLEFNEKDNDYRAPLLRSLLQ
ncbi:hypothetical protein [Alishewanella sp. HL-SH05]|uniref:hypothetical protein n=1 Tax=Alishewanella sp. HL-SH05 TaxID=3461145 RepID=UPI0040425613